MDRTLVNDLSDAFNATLRDSSAAHASASEMVSAMRPLRAAGFCVCMCIVFDLPTRIHAFEIGHDPPDVVHGHRSAGRCTKDRT